ncbi:head scaffolding protein [Synechococcus virus S-PRM1]|uniref:Scaffold prohead core protein n=1 Tax=Synechococcus virus S-PRM1 TaxID=2100130 RepID=A0A346FKM2_9CAUD|nr:head scaffolding protein [Synechococcus virus S-PRM1]AXN58527.1 scaffold prohead core protein [Synechococcus virus S-PRM1]
MSVGNDLQEMEVGTVQSKTAVNSAAKGGDPMPSVPPSAVPGQAIEDLGGPTPENYRADDDSAKLREPRLSHVSNVVNARAAKAEPMQSVGKEASYEETEAPEEETITEEEVTETPDYSVEEDMAALFSGEELTEEFQEKAKTIFEAAINFKVSQIAEEMEKKNEERIVEEIETVKGALVERVDAYLEYVADEWLQENEIAVEHGLKSEMTESFLSGMKDLFEAHYVSIPEDKYDVVENMVNKLDEMETKLNEQIERNVSLNQRLAESTADGIVSEVAEGLALSQKEKLAQLAESVEFESEESYREKLSTLKESYFGQSVQKETSEQVLTEESAAPDYSGQMAAYMSILDRVKK